MVEGAWTEWRKVETSAGQDGVGGCLLTRDHWGEKQGGGKLNRADVGYCRMQIFPHHRNATTTCRLRAWHGWVCNSAR